jgi:hypothetical protein
MHPDRDNQIDTKTPTNTQIDFYTSLPRQKINLIHPQKFSVNSCNNAQYFTTPGKIACYHA